MWQLNDKKKPLLDLMCAFYFIETSRLCFEFIAKISRQNKDALIRLVCQYVLSISVMKKKYCPASAWRSPKIKTFINKKKIVVGTIKQDVHRETNIFILGTRMRFLKYESKMSPAVKRVIRNAQCVLLLKCTTVV